MDSRLIHKQAPYDGFDYREYALDLQGWGSTDPNFRSLIDEVEPSLIVEVGTWKGGSAIYMAEYVKERGIDCKILCVDTWLGAIEFYTNQDDPDRYRSLGMRNGFPTVYYQFLANVMHKGVEDIIIPFPQTAQLAARFLLLNGVTADMIYIDASHDEKDVYEDINNYWQVLRKDGVLFGDDYDEHWPGVKLAVNNFVHDNDLELGFTDRQWMVRKRTDAVNKASYNIHQRSRENKKLALEYERDLFLVRGMANRLASERDALASRVSELEADVAGSGAEAAELRTDLDKVKAETRDSVDRKAQARKRVMEKRIG